MVPQMLGFTMINIGNLLPGLSQPRHRYPHAPHPCGPRALDPSAPVCRIYCAPARGVITINALSNSRAAVQENGDSAARTRGHRVSR